MLSGVRCVCRARHPYLLEGSRFLCRSASRFSNCSLSLAWFSVDCVWIMCSL